MNKWNVLIGALALGLAAAGSVIAVEDGLGTNHVRTLRAQDGIVLGGQKIASWDEVSASTLTNDSVTTDMIQNNAVTAAKIAAAVAGDGLNGGAGSALTVDAGDGLTITAGAVTVDSSVVRTNGAQTIGGVKTFEASPIVPTPTTDFQAAPKGYVDSKVSGSVAAGTAAHQTLRWDGSAWTNAGVFTVDDTGNVAADGRLDVGGTLEVTGAQTNLSNLVVGGNVNVTGTLGVTGATTLDDVTLGGDITFSGAAVSALAMGGFGITGLAAPSAGTDAATKTYVDNTINGLSWKDAVRAASVGNVNLAITLNGVVLDGVTLTTGDRVLLREQTTTTENGIYVVNAGVPTRALDMNESAHLAGAAVFASEGTANAGTAWVCTTPTANMGAQAIAFAQFASPGTYEAGDGLALTGLRFDVAVGDIAGAGLENDGANNLRIAAAAVGDGLTGGAGSALAVNSSVVRTNGAQTIGGVKTFEDSPIVPTPTTDFQAAPKGYVDSKVSGSVAAGTAANQILRWDGSGWTNADAFAVDASGNAAAGGALGIGGALTVTGAATVANTTESTDKDTGALIVEGGVGVEKNLNVGGTADITGDVAVTSATAASDKNTGALVVTGGAGIGGNLYAGGNVGVTGTLAVAGNTTLGDTPASDTLTVNAAATFNNKIIAPPSGTTMDVTAAGGITDISRAYLKVRGDGGPVDITANPQITMGVAGQILTVQGTSDANSLKLDDGTGLALNSGVSFTLKNGHMIQFICDGTVWRELTRTVPAP